FAYFIRKRIYWVYEAIYVQGFFQSADSVNQLSKRAHESRSSEVQISWRPGKELLHAELFQGVFGKALAFCTDRMGSDFELEVRADRTDPGIIKKFEKVAYDLLHVGEEQQLEVKGFDKRTKQVVRGSIIMSMPSGASALSDFSRVTYSIN